MHALIVVSHPVTHSLTHSVAQAVADGITAANAHNSAEIADLTREGFNPIFSAEDSAAFAHAAPLPADVLAEQARIDNADALVLVFPIYWWTMPGLLKGWIDRVFSNGWAYEEGSNGKVAKKLGHLPVHLVALGGADLKTFEKHGYAQSWKTQIAHGIFDYCGAPVMTNTTLMMPDLGTPEACLHQAHAIGQRIF
ncbi:NAD(P)H-dependent oxidoreductase [Kosakonia sp. ML.JS2a]|uniref:NAD(P)H-dependent oxidoreductase n=1 Tax=Kosakonia sp. ML.JS2a TaxID=2980557 RepID=UPI0021D84CC0|nr:NAD(P)H-dependent oxidoreductase [Kosakonia sp. ML.JS2a]UXY11907.1 NAD(P)H-dependent oxidoreductase [Kosakonia sp. ML.JS2a]